MRELKVVVRDRSSEMMPMMMASRRTKEEETSFVDLVVDGMVVGVVFSLQTFKREIFFSCRGRIYTS